MKNQIIHALFGLALLAWVPQPHAAPVVDCACVQNLPALIVSNCPALVPDLCSLSTNCFSTNVVIGAPGYCYQSMPPGTPAYPGTNTIFFYVTDAQTNTTMCQVQFIVVPPPNPVLTLVCPSNKTVQCGSGWGFDTPVIVSTCCDPGMTAYVISTVTNGTCPRFAVRTWQVTNLCGLTATCSQVVTIVDTLPPGGFCSGINLVPNGSFESNNACPTFFDQVYLASPWFKPTIATSDYMNACTTYAPMSVPTNALGIQTAYNGQAYCGAILYNQIGLSTNDSYREYLEVPLVAPLVAAQTYQVSFRVSLAETSSFAIANIGAHLSVGPVVDNAGQGVLTVIPQVFNPTNNPLASTNSWMLIQGTFTAAGGEDHLTLGSFVSDPNTVAVPSSGTMTNRAYYYFDDVIVRAICPPTVTNKTAICGQPWSFDTPVGFDLCSGTNVAVTVLSTVTNGPCPRAHTRTWRLTDLCGNTNTVSQTVTLLDTTPPIPVCNGNNLVPNPGFDNFNTCPTNYSQLDLAYPWNKASDATPDYFNACAPPTNFNVLTNFCGGQTPFTGSGFAGAYVYSSNGETNPLACYREYLQVPLISPLVAGQTYPVSFRVSLADISGHALAEIGAHFSVGSISNGIVGVLNAVPQVVNPSTNLLTSTNSWMLVSGFYIATGGETHLTLGCFVTDAAATATPILVNATNVDNGLNDVSYYYFDDVYVGGPCSIAPLVMIPCGTPVTFPNVAGYDACSGTNLTNNIVTVTNSLCPLSVTRTWTFTDLCGNTTNVSQTVSSLADTEPPIPICTGTNLVPNPSFETYTNCPYNYSQLNYAMPWYSPGSGTSDYFNLCGPFEIPVNAFGSRYPFTGQAYAGAYLHYQVLEYREYLQTPLTMPMVAGQTYTVSFRVSLAESSDVAISQIGAHFSVNPVTSTNYFPLNVVPQFVNAATNFLTNTNGWTLVAGNYTAVGGEAYLTLGNFLSNNVTAFTNISGGPAEFSYYYFDDVRVIPATPCPPQEIIAPCGQPLPFTPVTANDNCSGTNITTTITDTTNSTCPLIVTRTWTFTDLCGNSTNVSQQVFATDNQPPVVNCACLLSNAQPLLFTNACHGVIPNLAFLTNSGCATDNCGPVLFYQSPPAGTVVNPGSHPITLTFSDCYGNSTNCALTYNVLGPLVAIFTPPDIFALTCSNSAIVNFNLNYFGLFGPITCTPPSGSSFPLGTNIVTCIGTTSCGDPFTNTFKVIVRSARVTRWSCMTFVIGIPYEIIKYGGGVSSARMVNIPDFPGGGMGANFENFATDGKDGPRFNFGAAEKFTFSTELDFNAANGAGFELVVPPGSGETNGTPLLRFQRSCDVHCGWNVTRPMPVGEPAAALYRSIAIGTNGELFSSFTQNAAALNTNVLLNLAPMNGATSVVMTVTLDCHTREVMLDFPFCTWTPDAARKGWDACIYRNGLRGGSGTNKTARFMLTPLTTVPPPPITNLDLIATNLPYVPFDNPSLTSMGRKWGDGHVTLMKAYDDGAEEGVDFTSLGNGGGVRADLGHAASFQFRMEHFQNGDVPDQEQIFRLIGSPLTTNSLRFTQTSGGTECAADFTQWGVSNVTVQLWNGATLVSETNHVPATLASSLVSLGGFPGIISCPSVGVLSLANTNPITVLSGLGCSSMGCTGTELRIVAELPPAATPPAAFTGLECVIGNGMDNRISNLHTTPACTPQPINVIRTAGGISLNWGGDGFRLQGAETLTGAWYDLGVSSPVTLPASSSLRLFRLRCD